MHAQYIPVCIILQINQLKQINRQTHSILPARLIQSRASRIELEPLTTGRNLLKRCDIAFQNTRIIDRHGESFLSLKPTV